MPSISYAQVAAEYALKASYIEKFITYIEWPDDSTRTAADTLFVISVIGRNPFDDNLEKTFKDYKVKNRNVVVKYISRVDEIKDSKILFITEFQKNNLSNILAYTKGRDILTISDTNGFCESGVLINLYPLESRLRYEINLNEVGKSDLKFDSLFLNSARKIGKTGGSYEND
ncbi:YfiR family protein [candidate division KSB1 bacterium]